MTAGAASPISRWFMPPPASDSRLLFCFPYAGVGASSYRQWPKWIGDVQVCALQPPGRENRMREQPLRTHAEFAADLVDALEPHTDREFFFAGHCGAVPYALDTIDELARRGLRLPTALIASSWGAPQHGLYGRLNFVDLETADLVTEVKDLFGRAGAPIRDDFAEIGAAVLRHDLEVQRGYRFGPERRVPCPVTVVAWTRDDVVPPETVPAGWAERAEVTHELLDGEHLDFLHCPDVLSDALSRWLAAPAADHSDQEIRVGGD